MRKEPKYLRGDLKTTICVVSGAPRILGSSEDSLTPNG